MWVDGYDAGFAGKYDKDRAGKCNEIEGDQYNAVWGYGCNYAGYTEQECNDIKEGNDSIDYDFLKEELPVNVGMMVMLMDRITQLIMIETRNAKIKVTSIIEHSYTVVYRSHIY